MRLEISDKFIDFVASNKGTAVSDQNLKRRLLFRSMEILLHRSVDGYRRHNFDNGYEVYEGPSSLRIIYYEDKERRVIVDALKHDDAYDYYGTCTAFLRPTKIAVSRDIVSLVEEGFAITKDDDFLAAMLSYDFPAWFVVLLDGLSFEQRAKMLKKEKVQGALETKRLEEKERKEANRLLSKLRENKARLQKAEAERERDETPVVINPIIKTKEEEIAPTIVIQPEPVITQSIEKRPEQITSTNVETSLTHEDVEAYERTILDALEEAYEKKKAYYASLKQKPLSHVKFASQEIVVEFVSRDEALTKIDRRIRRTGLLNSNKSWLIILANTVEESLGEEIFSHYPNKVVYTDEPEKGQLDVAIIVKKVKRKEEQEDIQTVSSKSVDFSRDVSIPTFEIESDEYVEKPKIETTKFVKSKTVDFSSNVELKIERIDDDNDALETSPLDSEGETDIKIIKSKRKEIEPDLSSFNLSEEEDLFPNLNFQAEEIDDTDTCEHEEELSLGAPWKCYLCGKKKVYFGEPPRTVHLQNGKVVYLCKKHQFKEI